MDWPVEFTHSGIETITRCSSSAQRGRPSQHAANKTQLLQYWIKSLGSFVTGDYEDITVFIDSDVTFNLFSSSLAVSLLIWLGLFVFSKKITLPHCLRITTGGENLWSAERRGDGIQELEMLKKVIENKIELYRK